MGLKKIVFPLTFALSSLIFSPSNAQENDFSAGTSFSKQPRKNEYKISLESESFWNINSKKDIHFGIYISTPLINKSDYWGSGGLAVKKGLRKEGELVLKAGPYITNHSADGLRFGLGVKFPCGNTGEKIGIESSIEKTKDSCFYLFGVNYNWDL